MTSFAIIITGYLIGWWLDEAEAGCAQMASKCGQSAYSPE